MQSTIYFFYFKMNHSFNVGFLEAGRWVKNSTLNIHIDYKTSSNLKNIKM